MMIDIEKIRIDGGTQPRENISEEVVAEYADAMLEGDKFPPIVVYNDGAKFWLADGFHRYHASVKAGFKDIEADVKSGTRRDAILYSVSANAKHGVRRTNADKRKAVLTLLNDEEWGKWSDSEIARRCEVHHSTVAKYRVEVSPAKTASENERTYTTKHGTTATMDTSNIGKQKPWNEEDHRRYEEIKNSDPSDFEEKEDNGYDLPDNVDPETGEVFERVRAERKGIGLEKAHQAIAVLNTIPPNDDLLQEGYDTVIRWINRNR